MTATIAIFVAILIAVFSIRVSVVTMHDLRQHAMRRTRVERRLIWLHLKKVIFIGLVMVVGLLAGLWWEMG